MPVLKIHGVPPGFKNTKKLGRFANGLVESVVSIEELGLKKGDVSVFFLTDLLEAGIGEELVCFADGLIRKDERTKEVRDRLAEAVKDCMVEFSTKHMKRCKMWEVNVRPMHKDDSIAASAS